MIRYVSSFDIRTFCTACDGDISGLSYDAKHGVCPLCGHVNETKDGVSRYCDVYYIGTLVVKKIEWSWKWPFRRVTVSRTIVEDYRTLFKKSGDAEQDVG